MSEVSCAAGGEDATMDDGHANATAQPKIVPWNCRFCTFTNKKKERICELCFKSKDFFDEEEDEHQVGGVENEEVTPSSATPSNAPTMTDENEDGMEQVVQASTSKSMFKDVLQCTICLDLPASPIHRCSNGHIFCGICKEKVEKCGLCQSTNFEVSVLAERLSRQLNFVTKCPHYESGCCNVMKCTEIKDHIQQCYHRNVICNEWDLEECNDVSIPFGDFYRHLKEKHGFEESLTFLRCTNSDISDDELDLSWPLGLTMKGDKCFIFQNYSSKGIAYFYTTVLGDKEEARKHVCELTLKFLLNKTVERMQCTWTIPVYPYHDYPTFKEPMPYTASISWAALRECCGDLAGYFSLSYRIL